VRNLGGLSQLLLFRLAFAQGFTEAINSEVHTFGFVSKNWNGYGLGFLAARYQDYQSTAPGDFIAITMRPALSSRQLSELSAD